MVRFSSEIEHTDFLNVLAAERRELRLTMTTDRPLRAPKTATHRRRVAQLREQVAEQIAGQLDSHSRGAFRGRIAVELRLSVPDGGRHDAALPALVKAYVDLLKGPVVFDDASVDHLLVLRQPAQDGRTVVLARCLPLSIFTAEYDRAFRLLSELETLPAEPPPRFIDGRAVERVWGLDRFDRYAREVLVEESRLLALIEELDAECDEQIEDDPDADADLGIPAGFEEFADPVVRAGAREQLRHTVALARGEELADQGFDARDRPGEPPDWLDRARMEGAAEVLELDDAAPGCFVLPAPPERSADAGEPGWAQMIAGVFAQRTKDRSWREARFSGPLALDIAFRGTAGRHSDLDNAARRVLREFERAFAANAPQVDGYRVYRRPAMSDDVRVRVVPAVRLELLSRAMDDARALVHG
jgi:Holliday junction resolvase RusA-like endonuclease